MSITTSLYNNLVCKHCNKDFGIKFKRENLDAYIKHLFNEHHQCSHNICHDLTKYELPPCEEYERWARIGLATLGDKG